MAKMERREILKKVAGNYVLYTILYILPVVNLVFRAIERGKLGDYVVLVIFIVLMTVLFISECKRVYKEAEKGLEKRDGSEEKSTSATDARDESCEQ